MNSYCFLINNQIHRNTKPTIDEDFLKSPSIDREEEIEELKKQEQFKRFSNSSYLTPEAASYLNELMRSN